LQLQSATSATFSANLVEGGPAQDFPVTMLTSMEMAIGAGMMLDSPPGLVPDENKNVLPA
jgi:hypothetical protein